jgi:hypothetical protein
MSIELNPKTFTFRIGCDACKKPIKNYAEGIVIFNSETEPMFVHKMTCDPGDQKVRYWWPLEGFINEICDSVKVPRPKIRRKSE